MTKDFSSVIVLNEITKRGSVDLDTLYHSLGAKTSEEKHKVRGSLSNLKKHNKVTNIAPAVWST